MAGAAAGSDSIQEATDGVAFSSWQAVLFVLLYVSYLVNVMSQSSLEVAMPLAGNDPAVALCAATHTHTHTHPHTHSASYRAIVWPRCATHSSCVGHPRGAQQRNGLFQRSGVGPAGHAHGQNGDRLTLGGRWRGRGVLRLSRLASRFESLKSFHHY